MWDINLSYQCASDCLCQCILLHFTNCRTGLQSIYLDIWHSHDISLIFQSDSSLTITCANGKWNKQVSCEPVDCGLPDKYHVHPAHFNFSEGTTYGKKSTFQCREPAQLVGKMLGGAKDIIDFTF